MDQFGFEDFEVSGARPGPKSGAQTPAKPSERKRGLLKINLVVQVKAVRQ